MWRSEVVERCLPLALHLVFGGQILSLNLDQLTGWVRLAGWVVSYRNIPVSVFPCTRITGAHHPAWLCRFALGIRTQVLTLAQETFYQLSRLSSLERKKSTQGIELNKCSVREQ